MAINLGRKFLWRPRMAGVLCVTRESGREGLFQEQIQGIKSCRNYFIGGNNGQREASAIISYLCNKLKR